MGWYAPMARWKKILAQARNSPGDVRLDDARALAGAFGYTHRAGGKHPHLYKRKGSLVMLNFQESGNGKAKAYQVRQLLDAIDELGGVPPGEGDT